MQHFQVLRGIKLELQPYYFSLSFMLHKNLENINLQGPKIIQAQKDALSIISLEALQRYFEGADHKLFLDLWERIIPFKMHDKAIPKLHLDSKPAYLGLFLQLFT